MTYKPKIESSKIEYVTVESTQDLIQALEKYLKKIK